MDMSLAKIHEEFVRDSILPTFPKGNCSLREEWLHSRRIGIGGSDVAAILGLSPWNTPLDVYNEKLGLSPIDLEETQAQHFGNVLEDVVAREYARRTGFKIQRRNDTFGRKDEPWLRANIDRKVVGRRRGLECKTSSAWLSSRWGEDGSDEVPDYYLVQCLSYMRVLEYGEWDLAALIGGNDFRMFHLVYDIELAEFVADRLRSFWFDHVVAGVPPEPINLDEVNAIYRRDNGEAMVAGPELAHWVSERKRLKADMKFLEKEAQGFELEIKKAMGETQIIVDASGKKLQSWKTQTSNRLDQAALKIEHPSLVAEFTKPSESRVFR